MNEKNNPFGGVGGCYYINENLERVEVSNPQEVDLSKFLIGNDEDEDDASN